MPGKTIMVSPPINTEVNNRPVFTEKRGADSDPLTLLKQRLVTDWNWILAAIVCALILIVYWYAANTKMKRKPVLENRFSRSRFKRACFSGDASAARIQLIALAGEQWPGNSIAGLNLLKARSNSADFSQQLAHLDAVIYGRNHDQWKGQRLWQAFVEADTQKCRPTLEVSTNLPGLYPL